MLPVMLDVRRLSVAVTGEGAQTLKRLQMIDAARGAHVSVFAPEPIEQLRNLAGARLIGHWPTAQDLKGCAILFVGDVPRDKGEHLFALGRSQGCLVNVEDVLPLCDFHVPSILRRGDLVMTVSTGGKSPALAQMIRARIGVAFGPEWEGHLDAIAELRAAWKAQGCGPAEITRRTQEAIEAAGWFSPKAAPDHQNSQLEQKDPSTNGYSRTSFNE
ncbi:MAG TPA: siroheme synthase [Alphaproteobacteria bacterium]|nr:siroheme synthase [Alphaproteobacteria bacterium]HAJ46061.1 siroheme synthase [Alphaproteobacteria bacterium]